MMKGKRKTRLEIGDRSSSDVIVRLRTDQGRDEWLYCHGDVLSSKSNYFADRLSDSWPTYQLLDSRYCVDVYCDEPDFDSHVVALRLLYADEPFSSYGVRTTLGILKAAIHLGCSQMVAQCVEYLECSPWEEADEDEILKAVPLIAPQLRPYLLSRLQPVGAAALVGIFLTAFRVATSSTAAQQQLKSAAQDQLEYVLTEDDDSPLLAIDEESTRSEVRKCVAQVLVRFRRSVDNLLLVVDDGNGRECGDGVRSDFRLCVGDVSWLSLVLSKLEMMNDLVHFWADHSPEIVKAVEAATMASTNDEDMTARVKVLEVTGRVVELVSFGSVVLQRNHRRSLVDAWLPYTQQTKPLVKMKSTVAGDEELADDGGGGMEAGTWAAIESALGAIVTTLPSNEQAEVVVRWLGSEGAREMDLSEVLETWCYRAKVARRRRTVLQSWNIDNR